MFLNKHCFFKYDLQKDPYELNNLIRKPEYQQLAKELNKKLREWPDRPIDCISLLNPSLKRRVTIFTRVPGN